MSGFQLPRVHPPKKVCRQCNDDFLPYRHRQKFCSDACRLRYFYLRNRGKRATMHSETERHQDER